MKWTNFLPLLKAIFFLCFITGFYNATAQEYIKINNLKINRIDKQKKKQGQWFFFTDEGDLLLSCTYTDDSIISPIIFYEDNDTSFIAYPKENDKQPFLLYTQGKKHEGIFTFKSDSTYDIELAPDADDAIMKKIKKYAFFKAPPVYFFAQKKLVDYYAFAFSTSSFIFNKNINVILTINSNGIVTNVELPKDKNNLSADEERELQWIYSRIPRWQPLFYNNKTRWCKIIIGDNMSLRISTYDH